MGKFKLLTMRDGARARLRAHYTEQFRFAGRWYWHVVRGRPSAAMAPRIREAAERVAARRVG